MTTPFKQVYELTGELDSRHVRYDLQFVREALMLSVAVPGERWEIEFFENGSIELERFVSRGVESDPLVATHLLEYFK
ncbi:MAG: hypothetical protein ABSG36_19675 [Acidimicrobiales bacterium]